MTLSPPSASGGKADLRRRAAAIRREAHDRLAATAGTGIAAVFLAGVPWNPECAVAGYWPMAGEADVRPLLEALAARGCRVGLPVVESKGRPLAFRLWQPGMALEAGPHGTAHPPTDVPVMEPDLLLVPMLAFDRRGRRLGYGGGYYDRTLALLRGKRTVTAVGIAYAAQEMPVLPDEPHDQRLDWVVTETAALEALS
ncbi:5-formyltetrahydrofolate cyclo-ligase [Telmatospirillum siberiense]|uniref:5-formyltetrahydrofolate cyclo-ligase n=1 Tax=Telmatospirillum siberiense TaxID=382514 RepID=A0A2N3PXT2_9PROT|nr:5-formyltetrahydrofolate cyclo-ligase [Telmatospirillum siberiense]PKU25207.1 5-formyltetrahydrofolate cyclo-ligase [Telmatospirillum siberiense]